MNKKMLACALLGALGMAQSAAAQDFDDRWYVAGGAGIGFFDSDRNVEDNPYLSLGLGRQLTANVSLDSELAFANPDISADSERTWRLASLATVVRYHFLKDGSNWHPYVAIGLGSQRHEERISISAERKGANLLGIFGAGIQGKSNDRWSWRGEAGWRVDTDDGAANGESRYHDIYAGISVLMAIGEVAAPPPPPAPPAAPEKTCADMDDDGDGVNNCNDKCPGSQAGQAIGPDGCPVPLTIDLKGVNFDFDKDALRPDAVAILDEAVAILQKYPQLRVEVAGHTDATGPDNYNQGLSERRAKAVYEFLTGKGIDAARLVGPNGFGESRPIDTNDTREGRARNRRTELNVQN